MKLNKRGVTLIELLVTMLIGIIAFMALAIPFASERNFWNLGRRQAEAQRDAQHVLTAIAKVGRQSTSYVLPTATKVTFLTQSCPSPGISFERIAGQLSWIDCAGATNLLIDGNRSVVTEFTPTQVSTNLVNIKLTVAHQNQQNEILETDIFLRNA